MSLDINLTNVQSIPIVVNANITAENNKVYHVVANATFTDPTPVEGRGYVVFVRNGTATIGGNTFSTSGNFIYRLFHSGAWALYPFGNINSLSTIFNAAYVPQSRTINGLDLSANRTLTTANINDSTNKRYVTDAQLTVIGNTSGTNTGDETQSSILSKLGWWNILNQTAGTVSSGTSNTITKSIALPSVPNVLNFRANFLKTGATNTYTVRAYLSAVDNNIGGTAILIATVTGANPLVNNLPLKRTFDIIAGNILGFNSGGPTPTDDVNLSNAKLNLAIPTGTPLYLIFAVQCTSASDSARFESAQINNFSF